MKKKAAAFLIAFAVLLSVSVPAFAASYSDLEGHWSKSYIEKLVERGMMSGYEDGTMKPDKNVTACEALVILSRLYTMTDDEYALIQSDYSSFVNENVQAGLSWARDEIAVCLAAGIITQSELKSLDLPAAIEKQKLAVFLVRAMQMEKTAQSVKDTKLNFTDASDISEDCRGHAAVLASIGIVTGDNNGNFSPKLNVTRGVLAKMVCCSIDYLEKNGVKLKIDAYSGITQDEGVISYVSGSQLGLGSFDGLTREITIPSGATVTVNGTEKVLTNSYAGCYVKITKKNGAIIGLSIENDSTIKWVQGYVTGKSITSEQSTIYVTDLSGNEVNYRVSTNVSILQDGAKIVLSNVASGSFVTMRIASGTATNIMSVNGNKTISGTVSQLSYGTSVVLKVTDGDGNTYGFTFDISKLPEITRGNTVISINKLTVGSGITLTIKNRKVTAIAMTDSGSTIDGELTSIVNSTYGVSWVLKKSDGTSSTLNLDETVAVYSGTKEIKLSDINVGDQVSVVVYGTTIAEVYLKSSAAATNKVSGSILLISTSDKQITVLTSTGKLVYVSTASVRYIIKPSTGGTVSLSDVATGAVITAYGEYTGSTAFKATVIILENL